MADTKRSTDGPSPASSSAFDYTLIPDWDEDFVASEDIEEFARALAAPENSPSTDDLSAPQAAPPTLVTALNDWRPIHQRVRRRKKAKKPTRRDEVREGFVYTILKWPLLLVVLGWLLFLSVAYSLTRYYIYLYEHWVTWRGRRQRLRKKLQNANTYEEWIEGAKELDTYLGGDDWKKTDQYAYYDSKTVRRVQEQLVKLRERIEAHETRREGNPQDMQKAVEELRGLLEACVKNNFVGFENPRLYSETYYGTKDLVQNFVDEVEASLSLLLRTKQLDQETKKTIFRQLGTSFGRTALCLSGGATFAYYHFGIAKALLDADLLPEVITGTSGGALVAGLLCTRTDEELKKLLVPALAYRITACHDDMLTWIKRWYRTGARFDSVDWARRCAWFTRGSMTFREAYERTGRILNVSCVPSDPHSPTILANYITSPDCVIWSAVLASAAVPGILNPIVLMKKDKDGSIVPYSFGHKWKDGSLRTDIPLKTLNQHFNVRFSIVSQVNPHISLFFFSSRGSVGRPVTHRRGRGWRGGFLGSATEQYLKLDLTKWLKVLRHLELLPRPLGQDWSEIWLQRFSGTVTIWPRTVASDFYYILSDPTPERLARMIRSGQQAAFPKLKFLANRAKIERLIQQGRRSTRSARNHEESHINVLSEDDHSGLFGHSSKEQDRTFSASSSSSSSPVNMPLGFSFGRRPPIDAPPKLDTKPKLKAKGNNEAVPESPSLTQRFSGWWQTISPTTSNAPARRFRKRKGNTATSPYTYADRPTSMFELRPPRDQTVKELYPPEQQHTRRGSFLREIRNQSRVFVDDDDGDEDSPEEFDGEGHRHQEREDEDVDQGAEDGSDEEHDAVFGDDEEESDVDDDLMAQGARTLLR